MRQAVEWLHNGCVDTQTQIQCTNNFGTWDWAVRPSTPIRLGIVAYYINSGLTVTFDLPLGATSDTADGTTSSRWFAQQVRIDWTPSAHQLGMHTIRTTWATTGAPTKSCDFHVTVAVDACDGHVAAAPECSGHGRCTMASAAWPCECDATHYGRLCDREYVCNSPLPLSESFEHGYGALSSAWNSADSKVLSPPVTRDASGGKGAQSRGVRSGRKCGWRRLANGSERALSVTNAAGGRLGKGRKPLGRKLATQGGHAPPPPLPLPRAESPMPSRAERIEGGEETGQGERDEQREVTGQGRPPTPKMVHSAEGGEGKEKRESIVVVVRSSCQKIILQMHTPARTSQCWSRQTQPGLGVCI